MPSTKDPFAEDALLLYPDNQNERFARFSHIHYETPIIKGVTNRLRRWPSDLFFAFLTACLVIGGLLFLIFVTVAFCLPAVIDNRWRVVRSFEIEETPNVYFLKLDNHTWSTREFCYVETAARKHSDLNVYLINLFREEPAFNTLDEQTENTTMSESKFNYSKTRTNDYSNSTPERQLQKQLVSGNTNVRSIDVSVKKFFEGSTLSNIARSLNDELLATAARAQLLWNSPGIVLNPNMYCNVKSVERFLCNRNKENCLPDNLATIEPENDIQATEVPCQAFVGFLLREISHNGIGEYTLNEAIKKYCPRLHYCPEIRILDLKSKCPTDKLDCPTVYSSNISQDDGNHENFVT